MHISKKWNLTVKYVIPAAAITIIFLQLLNLRLTLRHQERLDNILSQYTKLGKGSTSQRPTATTTATTTTTTTTNNQPKKTAAPPNKCGAYADFAGMDLNDTQFRDNICQDHTLYKLNTDGNYPLCKLHNQLPASLIAHVRSRSILTHLMGVGNKKLPMFVYKDADLISRFILNSHQWEGDEAAQLVRMAQMNPDTTFVDIGSNIGVYTVTAAALKLPTLSFDGNIRNLMRLRLSLIENQVADKSQLVWNTVSNNLRNLTYMALTLDCNVGGARVWKDSLSNNKFYGKDPIAVMPVQMAKVINLIQTKYAVMKMDIEQNEPIFVNQTKSLLKEKVIAFQIEWWHNSEFHKREEFSLFVEHYIPFRIDLVQLDFAEADIWKPESDFIDVLMIRKDFVEYFIANLRPKIENLNQ